jgi:hypothetical protein
LSCYRLLATSTRLIGASQDRRHDNVCPMKNNPDLKFAVGERIKFVLPSGSIEEGIVKAVFEKTTGTQLNVAFGSKTWPD